MDPIITFYIITTMILTGFATVMIMLYFMKTSEKKPKETWEVIHRNPSTAILGNAFWDNEHSGVYIIEKSNEDNYRGYFKTVSGERHDIDSDIIETMVLGNNTYND